LVLWRKGFSVSQHVNRELEAFRFFVEKTALAIIPDSIEERRPPEPDILCRLADGSDVAFELVEICSPKNARFLGRNPAVAKLIEKAYQELPGNLRDRLDSRFGNSPLSFDFHIDASRNRINALLPFILCELADQPKTNAGDWLFSARARTVLVAVRRVGRVDTPQGRPSFNIAGSFDATDWAVKSVLSKLDKKYETEHPVELVAYFGPLAWGKSRDWIEPLREALASAGLGPFRRVWVVGWSDQVFVYPENA